MKSAYTILIFLIVSLAYGQSYQSIVSEADVLYNNKDYRSSVDKYKEAFKIEQKQARDLYNAACSAALSGEKKLAFEWLNLALQNGWSNIRHIKTDSDLTSLHGSEEWDDLINEMQKLVDQREANYDKALQAKLLAIFDDDQTIRREYIAAQKEFGHQSMQADSLGKIMIFKDSINLIKVTEILDEHGWVGPDLVGGQANQTLFLVIQHSNLQTQQKYLPMMRDAVRDKKASSTSLALLEDRVALGEGKRQIYGSQIGFDEASNTSYVLPLDDPDNVDKRRTEVGLGPLSEYVKRWDIVWDVEEYKKKLPEIESKNK